MLHKIEISLDDNSRFGDWLGVDELTIEQLNDIIDERECAEGLY